MNGRTNALPQLLTFVLREERKRKERKEKEKGRKARKEKGKGRKEILLP